MTKLWRDRIILAAALALVYGGIFWWRSAAENRWAQEMSAGLRSGDIVMYSTQSCIYCAKARAWFEAHQIAFTECDVERNPDCKRRYLALGAPGTPTFDVRGTRLLGFSPEDLAQALKQTASNPAASAAQP